MSNDTNIDVLYLQRLNLCHWFNQIVLSPNAIPPDQKRLLVTHGCVIGRASRHEIEQARQRGYQHNDGYIIYPPGVPSDLYAYEG